MGVKGFSYRLWVFASRTKLYTSSGRPVLAIGAAYDVMDNWTESCLRSLRKAALLVVAAAKFLASHRSRVEPLRGQSKENFDHEGKKNKPPAIHVVDQDDPIDFAARRRPDGKKKNRP